MTNDISTKRRRSIRLPDYDYAQVGGYFVMICTNDRRCLFGEIIEAEMQLNDIGETIRGEWLRSAEMRAEIMLDEFVVMPNHLHGIVFIHGDGAALAAVGATGRSPLRPKGLVPRSLGAFVGGFKAATARRVKDAQGLPGAPLWQRGYYEHIIRDERDLERIRQYIVENPGRWAEDGENPVNWR